MNSELLSIIFGIISIILALAIPLIQKFQLWDLIRGRKPILRANTKLGTVDQFYFQEKKEVRFTYGILANIQNKDDGILLNKSKRDNKWKPIGGAIQFNDDIREYLAKKKINIKQDIKTKKYKAHNQEDMRFFAKVKETHKIDEAIMRQGKNFLIDNLKREILEEMPFIDEGDIKIGEIKGVISQYKEADVSPLKVNDFNQQFVFNVEINTEKIKKLNNKEDIKYFTLQEISKGEIFADTIDYLGVTNVTPKYKNKLNKKN